METSNTVNNRSSLKRYHRSDTLEESKTREPISIFQEIIYETIQSRKDSLKELLNQLRNSYSNEFKIGAAVTKGDDFFDSIAQRLNELKNEGWVHYEGIFTVKSLRKDCSDYTARYPKSWIYNQFENEVDKENYKKYISYTAEEIGSTEMRNPILGQPQFEGILICDKYNIKLEVIELRGNGPGWRKSEYGEGKKRLTIVKYKGHFAPLLNEIQQDIEQNQEISREEVYGTTSNQQPLTKRKGDRHDGKPSEQKRPRYDDDRDSDRRVLLKELKQSIQDLLNQQPQNLRAIDNIKGLFERYKDQDLHVFFSLCYNWFSKNSKNLPTNLQVVATELAKLWIALLNNKAMELAPQQISGTYNSLSKLNVLRWSSSSTFKSLIIGLANRAKDQTFNAQEIANIYNALSKFGVLNTEVWNHDTIQGFKALITQLAGQAKDRTFNAQKIANIYNALSKWVNNDNIFVFKTLIIQLVDQAEGKDFDAQNIANIYNALSKFDILNPEVWNHDTIRGFKALITQLAGQAKDRTFNAQEIANIYNALSKWVNDDNIFVFKTLITQLVDQAKDRTFNAQGIANIYNALSKWVNNDNIVVFKTLITQLAGQAEGKDFDAQNIANIYNALSKFDILNPEIWNHPNTTQGFKALIIKLSNQAQVKDFNAQGIANIYNALTKFNILNTEVWNHDTIRGFKALITQLAGQAEGKDFDAQSIANIYNALSKWVNNDNIVVFKTLITQLAGQAEGKDFDAQNIANIYNALSKWVNNNNVGVFKTLIAQLAGQARDKNFNAQDIANIYNALSKWVDTDIWRENENVFKTLITQLAGQAKDRTFNVQNIANIYNALSKWVNNDNIVVFKTLITQLARQAQVKDLNAQDIANIYKALSKYPKSFIEENKTVFQDLVKVLAVQVINAKQFQKRSSASVIRDLPKLANLIADNYPLKILLISLMRSFTHREYQNRLTDLSGYFSEESCWTTAGVKDLAESIQKLNLSDNDKRELEIAFNDDIPKILNRLARFRLNSYKLTSILEGVTKLISSGVASNNDDIIQPLNKLFGNLKRYGDGNKLTPETLEFLKAIPHKKVPESHVAKKDLKLTITNIVEENAAESKRYNLPEGLERFKEEVLKPQGIEYISEDKFRNLKIFIAEVRVLGRNQWGIYAGESIEAGKFLGTYDGERMSSKNADRDRKDSAYLFDVSKSITIDASRRRNWAAYVNYGTSGTANVNSGSSGGRSKQIELRAYETVPVNPSTIT